MAKDAEASLILKIKSTGEKAIENAKKQFDGLSDTVVNVAKQLAALFSVMKLTEFTMLADKVDQVKKAFNNLAESQGQDAEKMLASMKKASLGAITELELMQQANQAVLLGLPLDRFGDMLKIAQSSAAATGQSMDFMLNSIVVGLGRGSKLMLDNLGILFDLDKANEEYAATLGLTADKLSEGQKKQAFLNKALEVGLENSKNAGAGAVSLGIQWEQTKVTLQELSVELGKQFVPALKIALKLANDTASGMRGFFEAISESTTINNIVVALTHLDFKFQELMASAEGFYSAITFDAEGIKNATMKIAALEKDKQETLAEIEKDYQARSLQRKIKNGEMISATEIIHLKELQDKEEKERKAHEKRMADGKIATEKKAAVAAEKEKKKIEDEYATKRENADLTRENTRIENAKKSQKDYLDIAHKEFLAAEKAKIDAAEEMEKEHQEFVKSLNDTTVAFLSGGLESVTKKLVTDLTETFLPGFGGAAGAAFELLSQDAAEFEKTMQQFFSADFLKNIIANIPVFFRHIEQSMPDVVQALITALIKAGPQISVEFAKTVASPKFQKELALAVFYGFKDGILDALAELREAIKDTFSVSVGGGGGGPKSWFNSGGIVRRMAAGGVVDNQMIMARAGEAVIPAQTVQNNPQAVGALLAGRSPSGSGGGMVININAYGGLLGNDADARKFAQKIDSELLKLRRDKASVAFDSAVY